MEQWLNRDVYERLVMWVDNNRSKLSEDQKLWLFEFSKLLDGAKKDARSRIAHAKKLLKAAIAQGFKPEGGENTNSYSVRGPVVSQGPSFSERRRDPAKIVALNPYEIIVVRFVVNNSAAVEHPLPKHKIKLVEAAIQTSGKFSIFEILTKFRFRRTDREAILALMRQLGYRVEGQMVYALPEKMAA